MRNKIIKMLEKVSKLEYTDRPDLNPLEVAHNKALWLAKGVITNIEEMEEAENKLADMIVDKFEEATRLPPIITNTDGIPTRDKPEFASTPIEQPQKPEVKHEILGNLTVEEHEQQEYDNFMAYKDPRKKPSTIWHMWKITQDLIKNSEANLDTALGEHLSLMAHMMDELHEEIQALKSK